MQSVCQLYEDDSDILCHGEKHLAQVLCLHLKPVRILILRILGAVCQMQVLQLRDAIHQMCDIVSKLRAHLIHGHDGVLQHIMEQSCCNGFLIQLKLGEYYGNTKRMYDIRLS